MVNYPAKTGPFGLWDFGPGDRTAANDVREIYWDSGCDLDLQRQEGRVHRRQQGRPVPAGPDPQGGAGSSDQRGPDVTAVALAGHRRLDRAVPLGAGAISVLLACAGVYLVYHLPFIGPFLEDKAPFGIVVTGVIYGTVNALLAIGLILIYKTSRFINFAYASMGSLAGVTAIGLHLEKGVPFFAAVPIGVVIGMVTGLAVELDRAAVPQHLAAHPHRGEHRHRPDPQRDRGRHRLQGARVRVAHRAASRSRSTGRSTSA